MTDKRFDEVVQQTSSCMQNRQRAYKALCATCGSYSWARVDEFKHPVLTGTETLGYVAKMRAWNCCHEGEEPIDGLPDEPDNRFDLRAAERKT